MTTGPCAVPRLGDPVAHPSGVLVRELGGRWGAGRLGAAGFAARCAVHGAGGGDSHGVGGEHAMRMAAQLTRLASGADWRCLCAAETPGNLQSRASTNTL